MKAKAQSSKLKLVSADLGRQLRECEREIGDFELKYRMTFTEFAEAWESDEIPNKWSHQVERDYMIWEGLEAEKRKWSDGPSSDGQVA
ncbi:MAG: hypothetical protein H8E47_08040 [Anaerolineales bacterium]|nr:hypothetical protein [Anaerolineales bacterium]